LNSILFSRIAHGIQRIPCEKGRFYSEVLPRKRLNDNIFLGGTWL